MDETHFRREHRRALVDDTISGASQLARQALDSLIEYTDICSAGDIDGLRARLLEFAEELQFARPSMAPVYNLVQRWADQVERLEADDVATFRQHAATAAQELSDASIHALEQAAGAAAGLITEGSVVITHSFSSTVRDAFRQLQGRTARAIVSESRPGMEGRDQARYLAGMDVDVTFITDAQLGLFSGHASLALVGADTVLADGSVVNKAGTYLLALAARDHGVPFYVCCESFKHAPFHPRGFELDEMSAHELEAPRHKRITARNVLFDITPAKLVDGWITEKGVHANKRAADPER